MSIDKHLSSAGFCVESDLYGISTKACRYIGYPLMFSAGTQVYVDIESARAALAVSDRREIQEIVKVGATLEDIDPTTLRLKKKAVAIFQEIEGGYL